MKFGKKLKDLQNTKTIEPQAITGINRLVCTSKSQNVELKGKSYLKTGVKNSDQIICFYFS